LITSIGCKHPASTIPPNDPDIAFMNGGIAASLCTALVEEEAEEEAAGDDGDAGDNADDAM
jgi:hypothetical protein